MGKPKGEVPPRETPEFRETQTNGQFRSWLRMQDAVIELEFIVRDAPELKGHLYTREGLVVAERTALELFDNFTAAVSDDTITLGMRFVYLIGETFRRTTEGTWVALPRSSTP